MLFLLPKKLTIIILSLSLGAFLLPASFHFCNFDKTNGHHHGSCQGDMMDNRVSLKEDPHAVCFSFSINKENIFLPFLYKNPAPDNFLISTFILKKYKPVALEFIRLPEKRCRSSPFPFIPSLRAPPFSFPS